MPDLYLLSVLAFVALVAFLIWRDRANVEWRYGVLFMRRTERFKDGISALAARSPRLWKGISTFAIFVCFVAMAYGLWLLGSIAAAVAAGLIRVPALQFILPTPSAVGTAGPGYILIPFWFWLVTIFTILVPHELLHGVITRVEKLRLRSVGLLLLAIFPGAFVEPDERQLKRAPLLSRLRVYAAGSFANFLVAGTILALTAFVIWPAVAAPGLTLLDVNATGPAGLAGLTAGITLDAVNGAPITTSYAEYMSGRGYLTEEVGSPRPGDVLTFSSAGRDYNVTLGQLDNRTYMGVIYTPNMAVDVVFFLSTVAPLLTMLWLFSFAVGLFNVLPIPALDGGLMAEAVAERITRRYGKRLARGVGFAVLALIIYDFVGPVLLA